ncbi:MAG: hypothetical protein ACM4AI_02205 [Acidobacteriota bacterium]
MFRHGAFDWRSASLGLLAVAATACAPVFSDARLVGKGRAEITPSFSAAGWAAEGESDHVANNIGVHALYGVADRADVFVGYLRTQFVNDADGTNAMEFGPKLGIVRDRVAVALPVGLAFGGGVETNETWHFYPTALFTVPAGGSVDINPAVRVLIPTCEDCDVLVGVNLGAGIRLAGNRAILRPEFGILMNPGETGVGWHFGFAVSIRSRTR